MKNKTRCISQNKLDRLLSDAAGEGNDVEVQRLLKQGADMYAFLGTGYDPMTRAMKNGWWNVVDALNQEVSEKAERLSARDREEIVKKLIPAKEVLARLESDMKGHWEELILATGQYSPCPDVAERVLAFSVRNSAIRLLWDDWMKKGALPEITERLQRRVDVRTGSCDAMYATDPNNVWARSKVGFTVWHRRRVKLELAGDEVLIHRWLLPVKRLRRSQILKVRGRLSSGWLRRSVEVETTMAGTYTIGVRWEPSIPLDVTYDGLDVLADASWVSDMAKGLAHALDVPVDLNDDSKS